MSETSARGAIRVNVYSTPQDNSFFVFVPLKGSLTNLPPELQKVISKLKICAEIDLVYGQSRVGVDVEAALADIRTRGFHISRARVMISQLNRRRFS